MDLLVQLQLLLDVLDVRQQSRFWRITAPNPAAAWISVNASSVVGGRD